MSGVLRLAAIALSLASLFVAAVPAFAADSPALAANCQFAFGFKALHDAIPNVVGNCKTDEQHDADNGDGLQRTTGVNGAGGLLVWRKADNWTAFTDGFHTWLNGPNGVQERLNTQRFPWEADYDMLYTLKLQDIPPGFVADPRESGPVTNDMLIAVSPNHAQEQAWIQGSGRTGGYGITYYWNGALPVPSALGIMSYVQTFQSKSGAQAAMAGVQEAALTPSAASGYGQPISAPQIGDQSVAFTYATTIPVEGQSVPVTSYAVLFRVGGSIGLVVTAGLTANSDISQTISLAKMQATHLQAQG